MGSYGPPRTAGIRLVASKRVASWYLVVGVEEFGEFGGESPRG